MIDLRGRNFLKLLDFSPAEIQYLLDLAADFRVADENECRELRDAVMGDLLDRAYENASENEDFRSFVDTQGVGRNDKLVPELIGDDLPTFEEVTEGRFFDELPSHAPETVRYACADADCYECIGKCCKARPVCNVKY